MYVCIEVALLGDAHGTVVPTGPWEGPMGIVGPISQLRGTNGTASLMLGHTYALTCAF